MSIETRELLPHRSPDFYVVVSHGYAPDAEPLPEVRRTFTYQYQAHQAADGAGWRFVRIEYGYKTPEAK